MILLGTRTILGLPASINRHFTRAVTSLVNNTLLEGKTQNLKSWTEIPGPSSLPIIGQLLHFLPGGRLSDPSTFQKNIYDLYGPIARLDPIFGRPQPMIMLYDPESIEQILRGEDTLPIRPGFGALEYYRKYYSKTKEEQGKLTGLMTDHGENWRQFRTTVNPIMMQPKIIKQYSTALEEVSNDMVKRMKSKRDENRMIKDKFDKEIYLWSLECIGVVALGCRLNCLDPNLQENSPEKQLIRCVNEICLVNDELDFRPSLWKFFPTKTFRKAMRLFKEQEDLAKYFVEKAKKEFAKNKRNDNDKSVLEKLLEINEDIAVIMACEMLLAGGETTSNSVLAIIYLLAMNPDKQEKLRDELKSDQSKQYLSAVIKEAQRIYAVTAGNLRQLTKDHDVMGYRIPKDAYVAMNHQLLSIQEDQFPKPYEFIPERWIEKDNPVYYKTAHPFSFMPFGFGVRMCIGRRVSELETEIFITKLMQNFKIEWHGPPKPLKRYLRTINFITGPFNFVFKDI